MAIFKRKRNSRGSRSSKRRRMSGVRKSTSVPRGIKPQSLSVRRTFYNGSWAFSSLSTNGFWRYETFTLANLPNVSEYAALFDEYKINAIKVQYRPNYDSVEASATDAATAQTNNKLNVHTLIDQSSTTFPSGAYTGSTLNAFLENGAVRTRDGNKPFSVFYKPKMFQAVNNSGTAATVMPVTWCRTSDTAATHYGHHVFLQFNNMTTTGITAKMDVFVTYYLQFRGMK